MWNPEEHKIYVYRRNLLKKSGIKEAALHIAAMFKCSSLIPVLLRAWSPLRDYDDFGCDMENPEDREIFPMIDQRTPLTTSQPSHESLGKRRVEGHSEPQQV